MAAGLFIFMKAKISKGVNGMRKLFRIALLTVLFLLLFVSSAAAVSFSPNSRGWSSSSLTVNMAGGYSVNYIRYGYHESKQKVVPTTGVPSRTASWDVKEGRYVLAAEGWRRIVSGGDERWILYEPETVSGFYCYDKTRPNYPTATITYDASGDYVTSRTFRRGSWRVELWKYSNPQEVYLLSNNKLTVTSPGKYYFDLTSKDGAGLVRTKTYGPYTISSGQALTAKVLGGADYGGSGMWEITATWRHIPLPKPTVKAVPESRGWSNESVSVSLTFGNTTSQRAKWSGGSWTSYSSSSSRIMQKSEDGEWYLEVEASGGGGTVTKRFGPYRIDNENPRVMLAPRSGSFVESGSVVARFFDDHSGVKRYRVGVSDSSDKPPSSWSWVSVSGGPKSVSKSVSLPGYGVWYVHAQVEDNVGLKSDVVWGGPYVVLNKLKVPLYRRWVYLVD